MQSFMDTKDTLKGKLAIGYGVVIVGSFVIGAIKGFSHYLDWISTRKYRQIKYKAIEPVVNIGADGGKLVFDVVGCGTASALMGATAPISVPLALVLLNDNDNKNE